MRKPDFSNFLKVLHRDQHAGPVLFEFIICDRILEHFAGNDAKNGTDNWSRLLIALHGYKNAGYDFCAVPQWLTNTLNFPQKDIHKERSVSLNEGVLITDWESFEKYPWPDPDAGEYDVYEKLGKHLPDGMKLIAFGPSGVLENVVNLVGFENLCLMSLLDESLTTEIFKAVGERLLRYYEISAGFDSVGALIGNDDWGFKTQTMLDIPSMRKFVFPWHKKIVKAIHDKGKPAILHSCGNLVEVFDDLIDDIKYDAKHSYEDAIVPVEEAYQRWGDRIAVMGGIDIDFLCSRTEPEIIRRAEKLLEISSDKGGYALGSGNSIPDYIPIENYKAMISVIRK